MRRWTWLTVAVALTAVGLNSGELLAGKPGGGGGGGGGGGNTTPPDLLVVLRAKNGAFSYWTLQDDGSGQTKVTADFTVLPTMGSWSPDGTRVAVFAHAIDGAPGTGLFVMNADGTGLRRITDVVYNIPSNALWCPVPAPDGTEWIAFSESPDGAIGKSWDTYLVSADGTKRINVTAQLESTHERVSETPLAWSPDGTTLLCRRGFTYSNVRTLEFSYDDNKDLVLPTDCVDFDLGLGGDLAGCDWARGSDTLACAADGEIYVVDISNPANPGTPVSLTNGSSQTETFPTWSPDDSEVLCVSFGEKSLVAIRVSDKAKRTVATFGKTISEVRWPSWKRTTP